MHTWLSRAVGHRRKTLRGGVLPDKAGSICRGTADSPLGREPFEEESNKRGVGRGLLLRAASLVEYVLVLSCVSLVICLAGPPVADAIQGQFGQVQEVINNGSTGGSGGGGGDFPGGGSGDEQGGGGENPDKPGGGDTGGGTDPEKPGGGNTGGDTPTDPKPEEKRLGGSVELSPVVVGKVATATANGAQNDAVPGYEWSVEGKTVSTGATWVPSAEYAGKDVTVTAADTGGTYTGSISADAVVEQAELTGSIEVAPGEAGVESTAAVDGAPSDADIELAWKVDGAAIGTGDAVTLPDDSEGKTLVVEGRDKSGFYGGVISISLVIKADPRVAEAFAVYSEDDNSLRFYNRAGIPNVGDTLEGRTATRVYTGFETESYHATWDNVGSSINNGPTNCPWYEWHDVCTTIEVVDSGIRPKDMGFWFQLFTAVKSIDISKLDVSECSRWQHTFWKCKSLTGIDLSGMNVVKLGVVESMFTECQNLKTVNLAGWKGSPTNVGLMYSGCPSLANVDLGLIDFSRCESVGSMFRYCHSLTVLDLTQLNTAEVLNMSHVFDGCNRLQQVKLGEKFAWKGADGYLPAPDPAYIPGADGKWYAASDGKGYAPEDIPSNKADTYYASKSLLPAQAKTFSLFGLLSDGIDMLTDMLIGQGA